MVTTVVVPHSLIDPFRKICLALPDVIEDPSQGRSVFKVGRRTVTNIVAIAGPDDEVVTAITVRAPEDDLLALSASGHPFFRPRSANANGWVGVVLDFETDWSEIREVVIESYLLVAPKRSVEQLDLPE